MVDVGDHFEDHLGVEVLRHVDVVTSEGVSALVHLEADDVSVEEPDEASEGFWVAGDGRRCAWVG